MKNILKAMTVGLVAATALTVSAAAADFSHCADSLNQMNLFKGGTSGYELDRAPTRAEAATMLVRLLGKEADAQQLTYSAPFTDLENWEKPYVQYLYDNGLTNGATATTFAPESKCDAQMYSTFLLRALGYSDAEGGDFTYAAAVDKATALGVADSTNCDTENFLRDNVVAMSYTALSVQPKDQAADSLLAKLVAGGAVDKAKAQATLDFFKNYSDYKAVSEAQADETKMAMTMTSDIVTKLDGADLMTATTKLDIKADMNLEDLNKSKMAMTGTMTAKMDSSLAGSTEDSETEQALQYYYTDGAYYMQIGDQKMKMPMDFSSVQQMINSANGAKQEPITLFRSLTKSGNTYTVEYQPEVMNSMIADVLKTMNMDSLVQGTSVKINTVKATVTVKDGKMSGMTMNMDIAIGAEGQSLNMTMNMKADITATGDSVKVVLPTDLDTYTDLSSLTEE
ncbi:MAG: S-layer homology domain-containing protein [Intestinibacillus sp.]